MLTVSWVIVDKKNQELEEEKPEGRLVVGETPERTKVSESHSQDSQGSGGDFEMGKLPAASEVKGKS